MVSRPSASSVFLSPDKVEALFPFHVAFGADWMITQCGSSIARVCPKVRAGARFTDLFSPRRPDVPFDFETIWHNIRVLYLVLETDRRMLLRGQMVPLEDQGIVLFVASPWLTDSAGLNEFNLSFEDFAIHDSVVDLLHVLQSQLMVVTDLKKLTEKLQGQRSSLRAANQRLLSQEQESRKLALVAERTDNAVVLTESDGSISWVNQGFTRLTGYTLAEAVGRKPGSFLQGPRTDRATVEFIRDRIQRGQPFSAEILNYSKSGREYWISLEVQPIRDDTGQITNYMAIESDISARKDNERRLAMQYRVTRLLSEAGSLGEVLPRILETVCRNLFWESGAVWLVDPSSRRLRRIESWHPSASPAPTKSSHPSEIHIDDPDATARQSVQEWQSPVDTPRHTPAPLGIAGPHEPTHQPVRTPRPRGRTRLGRARI